MPQPIFARFAAATASLAQMGAAGWARRRDAALLDWVAPPEPGGWERELQNERAAKEARSQRVEALRQQGVCAAPDLG